MSVLTHSWAVGNLLPNQCRGCGVTTNGWAPTYTGETRNVAGHEIKVRGPNYPLCRACGGECCGDCEPCEFGHTTGGPSACAPPEDS